MGYYLLIFIKNNSKDLSYYYIKNLSNITNEYINNIMLTGNSSILKNFINKLVLDKSMLGIHIFNNRGEVYTSASNVNNKTDAEIYEKLIKTSDFSEKFVEYTLPSSKSFFAYYKPLINKHECKGCHKNSGSIVGLLNINIESSQFFKTSEKKTFNLIWILTLFSVLLSIVIIYMIKKLITDPIKKLEYAMAQVSNGNYNTLIHFNTGDEIESLSEYYNQMVSSIKNASETLNKMHRNMIHTDRLMTVGQITAAISHEIKNPLNSILIQADLLKSNIENLDVRDTLIKIEGIIADCEKISKIINQTLNFSKNIPESWEIIDVGKFLRDLQLFSRRIFFETNNIDFKIIDKRSNLYTKIYFNRIYLEQVFINLLKNAADAIIPKGSGTITLEVDNADDFITFVLTDNGIGIAEEKIKYIFNEFYTTKQDGTGIGLAIVKYILDIYNGSIEVKSTVNVGTTFTVKIPTYRDNLND